MRENSNVSRDWSKVAWAARAAGKTREVATRLAIECAYVEAGDNYVHEDEIISWVLDLYGEDQ